MLKQEKTARDGASTLALIPTQSQPKSKTGSTSGSTDGDLSLQNILFIKKMALVIESVEDMPLLRRVHSH